MSVIFFITIIFSLQNRVDASTATNTLVQGQSLSVNQSLTSKSGAFQFGFFPKDATNYFLGIWVKDADDGVVWVANKNYPLKNPSLCKLNLSSHGDLVLTQSESLIWSSHVKGKKPISTVAVLLDSGNLVLQSSSDSSHVGWESFEHLTDTWLQGASLGYDAATGKNLSLTSGSYSLESGNGDFIIRHLPSNLIYQCNIGIQLTDLRYNVTSNSGLMSYHYPGNPLVFIKLYDTGKLNLIGFDDSSNTREFIGLWWLGPSSTCDFNPYCGSEECSGLSFHYESFCGCNYGFEPAPPENSDPEGSLDDLKDEWYNKCSEITTVNCTTNVQFGGTTDVFSLYMTSEYPNNPQYLAVQSQDTCQQTCSSNCSCIAYSYDNRCKQWHGDSLTITIYRDNSMDNAQRKKLFVRNSFKVRNHKGKKWAIRIMFVPMVLVSVVVLVVSYRYTNWYFEVSRAQVNNSLVLYSYPIIKNVTRNFSDKIGEGGFGTVFKGSFPDSTLVAIKKLKGQAQDEKQFRTEVQTIGNVRHTNLVRLHGFCTRDTKRFLVYEYMPFGSLNSYLFSKSCEYVITWNARFKIILGIARGLAYMHEECRDCIIHCDIKPENILLDANFSPKIADFGMAKLLGREFSRALTTMRGTIGYLAPEWISGQPITQKADVYSFGMMLFEIISGKRNTEKFQNQGCTYFPVYAATKINQGEILCLLDSRLEGSANVEKLNIACKVACWCIQDCETDRPSMRNVVLMLEGVVRVEMPPVPRCLQSLLDSESDYSLFS